MHSAQIRNGNGSFRLRACVALLLIGAGCSTPAPTAPSVVPAPLPSSGPTAVARTSTPGGKGASEGEQRPSLGTDPVVSVVRAPRGIAYAVRSTTRFRAMGYDPVLVLGDGPGAGGRELKEYRFAEGDTTLVFEDEPGVRARDLGGARLELRKGRGSIPVATQTLVAAP